MNSREGTTTPALERAYEAAARALCTRDAYNWDELRPEFQYGYLATAKAAFDAARASLARDKEAMKLLGNVVTREMDAAGCEANACVADIWEAMWDAAPVGDLPLCLRAES